MDTAIAQAPTVQPPASLPRTNSTEASSRTGRLPAHHFGYIDALRGIAILAVMLVHSADLTHQGGQTSMLAFTGQRGVQLFYILSAFTLCLSMDSKGPEKHPATNYFIRRFFRIAPLFYLVLGFNILFGRVAPFLSTAPTVSRLDLLLGALFLNGLRPIAMINVVMGGWSIAVETTFYLLLPLLHAQLRGLRRTLVFFVVSTPILWYLCRTLSEHVPGGLYSEYFSFFWFPVEFPVFMMGMLAYGIYRECIQGQVQDLARRRNISAVLLLSSGMIYFGCLPFNNVGLYPSSFLFVPLLLALALHPWQFLVNRLTRFIGRISYSMYLLHFFVLACLKRLFTSLDAAPSHPITRHIYGHFAGLLPVYPVVVALSVGISVLSWKLIEQPGIELGRRIIAMREGRRKSDRLARPAVVAD